MRKKEKTSQKTSVDKVSSIEDEVLEVVVEGDKGFNTFEVVVIIILSILFGFVVGCIISFSKGSLKGQVVSEEAAEIISTYNSIVNNYYDTIDEKELMNAAISGMINSLDDPYSSYMDDSETTTFNQTVDGEYIGIGVTVAYKDGKCYILDIFSGSTAEKSGLKVNDIIIKVGKKNVADLSLDEISDLIKGKSGTKVKITILRDEEEKSFSVERSSVEVPSVSSKVITKNDKKIGYLLIDTFAANTYKQFNKELKKVEKKNIDSLIIDVRNNPGGHLSQVQKILEKFFDEEVILYQVETKGKKQKIYSTTSEERNYPIAILVNKSSASASEILASSFKDNYKNAYIVGNVTYGKGTIQKALELSSGASIKYTTQKWLTPKGKSINEKGVTPDYEVEQGDTYSSDPTDDNDTQLQKAIEVLIQKESN